MVFSSIEFLFVFLPLTLLVYYIVPHKIRNLVLLLFSLLFYGWGEPVYTRLENGHISDGRGDSAPSFFQEYTYKLEKMYDRFFTRRGRELAEERRQIAADFYTHLLREAREADGMPSD